MLGKLPHAGKEPRQIDAFTLADQTKFALLPLPHKLCTLLPDALEDAGHRGRSL